MTDIERELLELKERVSRSIGPSREMGDRVFRRARTNRVLTATTSVLVVGVLGLASFVGIRAFDAPNAQREVAPLPGVESPTPPHDTVVVGSVEETHGSDVVGIALRAINMDTGESKRLEAREFSPGDAQFALFRTGKEFVFRCSSGACALDSELEDQARTIGEAWCLSPSATEGRVWLAQLDPESPATVRAMKSIREVSLDGQVSIESKLPTGRWHCPVGAVSQGVLFQEGNDLVVWDAEAQEVVFRLSGPFPADTHGDVVAWCAQECEGGLHLTDIGSGEDARIESDGSFRFEETYDGAFSPDGSLLALPVATEKGEHPRQLAVVDVKSKRARLIGSVKIRGPMAWASSGMRLFVVVGRGRIAVYDVSSGELHIVTVDVQNIFTMAAG